MSKFKKIFKIAAPLALGFIPGMQPLAAAALGAGLGALGGGGLKGALLGGLGGGLGAGGLGGAAGSAGAALGRGISNTLGMAGTGAQTIGQGLSGALLGGATGGKQGAILGGLGGAISPNFGDIKDYVGGQANELGNFVDRNLGTNAFGPSSESLLAAPATSYAPNVSPELKGQVENSINYWQSQVPGYSGTESSGSGDAGTSSDAGGAAQTGAKSMKFSDILSGVSDYYSQDKMQEEQMDALRRAESAYSPYLSAGGQGLNELLRGYNPGDLTQDPSYQFRLAEGQKALEKSMAARGMLNSGQAMKAITDYGQNMASTAYDDAYRNWFARNAQLASYGNQNLGNMANIYGQMGDVSASSPLSNNSFLNALLAGQYGGL